MIRRKSSLLKCLTAAVLLTFGVGTTSTRSFAQEPPYCWQWAREYCASIGVPGNVQCITYWNNKCEIAQGLSTPKFRPE